MILRRNRDRARVRPDPMIGCMRMTIANMIAEPDFSAGTGTDHVRRGRD